MEMGILDQPAILRHWTRRCTNLFQIHHQDTDDLEGEGTAGRFRRSFPLHGKHDELLSGCLPRWCRMVCTPFFQG